VDGACGTLQRRERRMQGFGGKTRRKETTRKTEASMREWDKNGSWGDWLGMCRVDCVGSGLGPVEGFYECGNEPSGSGATHLVT
jgi:hypothetical protein